MAIVQTLSKSSFVEAFKQSSRKDQFSYEALETIFDSIEEYSQDLGENVEFDLVSICCDWNEEGWEGIAKDYSIDLEGCEDDADKIEAVRDYLDYHTRSTLLADGETFVYIAF